MPALPYAFDKPVEQAVEFVFHEGFKFFGGKEAVGDTLTVGREDELSRKNAKAHKGEKEL